MSTLGFIGLQNIGTVELLVILALGLLIFGRRLPEVGRSLGKGIVEFRKGLKGIEDDVEAETNRPANSASQRPLPAQDAASPSLHAAPAAGGVAAAQPADFRVSRSDTVE